MKELEDKVASAREIVVAWEKLRLIYNVVMLLIGGVLLGIALEYAESLQVAAPKVPPALVYITIALLFGTVANVCYCLGPYAELMLVALGYPESGQRVRYFLFGVGLLFSILVMTVPFILL